MDPCATHFFSGSGDWLALTCIVGGAFVLGAILTLGVLEAIFRKAFRDAQR